MGNNNSIGYSRSSRPAPPKLQYRATPLKVICVGLPRTGTASLASALSKLQYDRVYHFAHFQSLPESHHKKWKLALEAKFLSRGIFFRLPQWDDLLCRNGALTDIPCVMFAPELMRMYPDAKIILTVRDDVDEWIQSYMSTVAQHFPETYKEPSLLRRLTRSANTNSSFRAACRIINDHFLANIEADPRGFYEKWNQQIMSEVAKDRLLIFNVKDGWKPLCNFLGRPDATESMGEFPHLNTAQSFPAHFMTKGGGSSYSSSVYSNSAYSDSLKS